jgi:uncharacterized protein YjbJ (UPF0337 family)
MGEYTDKAKGEIKEKSGKLTGDKKMEWEGKGDKAKGHVQGAGRKIDEGLNQPHTDEGSESGERA